MILALSQKFLLAYIISSQTPDIYFHSQFSDFTFLLQLPTHPVQPETTTVMHA